VKRRKALAIIHGTLEGKDSKADVRFAFSKSMESASQQLVRLFHAPMNRRTVLRLDPSQLPQIF